MFFSSHSFVWNINMDVFARELDRLTNDRDRLQMLVTLKLHLQNLPLNSTGLQMIFARFNEEKYRLQAIEQLIPWVCFSFLRIRSRKMDFFDIRFIHRSHRRVFQNSWNFFIIMNIVLIWWKHWKIASKICYHPYYAVDLFVSDRLLKGNQPVHESLRNEYRQYFHVKTPTKIPENLSPPSTPVTAPISITQVRSSRRNYKQNFHSPAGIIYHFRSLRKSKTICLSSIWRWFIINTRSILSSQTFHRGSDFSYRWIRMQKNSHSRKWWSINCHLHFTQLRIVIC